VCFVVLEFLTYAHKRKLQSTVKLLVTQSMKQSFTIKGKLISTDKCSTKQDSQAFLQRRLSY